ncbi:hypothetical protein [Caballeronia sordidicola]|nr:hypothetical protein [Caballeronia sordidicola]
MKRTRRQALETRDQILDAADLDTVRVSSVVHAFLGRVFCVTGD